MKYQVLGCNIKLKLITCSLVINQWGSIVIKVHFLHETLQFQPLGVAIFKGPVEREMCVCMWPMRSVYTNESWAAAFTTVNQQPADTQLQLLSGYYTTPNRSDVQYDFWRNQWREFFRKVIIILIFTLLFMHFAPRWIFILLWTLPLTVLRLFGGRNVANALTWTRLIGLTVLIEVCLSYC